MTKRLRVAIVGAGYMAGEHAKVFAAMPEVELVGVCGRTPAKAKALADAHSTKTFDSIDAMYRDAKPDGVVITVNELSTRTVCDQCFGHGAALLIEKPVGLDLTEATGILQRSRAAGVRSFVAMNRRSYSSTRQAVAALESDEGTRLITVFDQQDLDTARQYGAPPEVVRNYMYANSIHLIDYFHILGRSAIVGVDPVIPWVAEAPGAVAAVIRYENGDSGLYQAVWNRPGPWSVAVTTPKHRYEMRPLEKLTVQKRGERAVTEIPIDSMDTAFKPGLRFQAEQFVAAMLEKQSSLATLDAATETMRLVARIYGHAADSLNPRVS
jgi:predicted dehydrogenase